MSPSIDIIDIRNRDWKRRVSHQLARTFSVGAEVADSKLTDIDTQKGSCSKGMETLSGSATRATFCNLTAFVFLFPTRKPQHSVSSTSQLSRMACVVTHTVYST